MFSVELQLLRQTDDGLKDAQVYLLVETATYSRSIMTMRSPLSCCNALPCSFPTSLTCCRSHS